MKFFKIVYNKAVFVNKIKNKAKGHEDFDWKSSVIITSHYEWLLKNFQILSDILIASSYI